MATEIHDSVKLVTKADIQRSNTRNRGWCGVEDGCIRVSIEGVVSTRTLVEIDNMKTVFAAGAHFDAAELYGVVGVEMKVETLKKQGGVHAIWGCDSAGGGGVNPVLKAKDTSWAADVLYGAGRAVNGVGVGRVLEIKGEGDGTCGGHSHLFCDAAVCHGVGIQDTR